MRHLPKMAEDHSSEWWLQCMRCHKEKVKTRKVEIDLGNIIVSESCFNPECGAEAIAVYSPLYKVLADG